MKTQKMIPIAKVGSTYRLKGELRLYMLSESAEKALSYGQWYLQKPHTEAWLPLENESVSRVGDKLFIQFEGVDNKEEAALYTNALIGVPRSALPEAEEGAFYWVDLIGLQVFNQTGQSFGYVKDILDTGANEVLCCRAADKEYLIPFVKQYVLDVDMSQKKILVDWQLDYL
ncbi:ribosome maturation factor RimM [Facilibium subflavum]|uniref:ribosome maturation factor RimM n=1 Tax=Facilibium subflavum TaxID=2219058 RepID=UPI000E64E1A7|nr:ribosome maturation factor RimM [Facilibium subflavum]